MDKRIKRNQCIYGMSPDNAPALQVLSGSIVVFETNDCFENQIVSEEQSIESLNWEHINPASGPLYIEGAEPGDVLKIEILQITVQDKGVMAAIPGGGLLGKSIEKSEIKIIPVEGDTLRFNGKIHLPLNPMIGVIGVAPAEGVIPCGTPGSHGGNMDNTKIAAGSTLYLPVYVPGALLAMGDLHAAMGDGEIMVTGVEIAGEVTVKVEVLKGIRLSNPMLEDKDNLYTIASAGNLLDAIDMATEDMHRYLMKKLDLSFNEVGMLLSASGNAQICQVVDPLLTVRFAFPRHLIEGSIW